MGTTGFRLWGGAALGAALASAALLVSLLAAAPPAGARVAPVAVGLSRCSIAKVYDRLGPTYVDTVRVHAVSCDAAYRLIRAFNTCRLRSGGVKGYCRTRVDGFRFSEGPRTRSSVEFIAKVTAVKGSETVEFAYTEDT